MKFPRFASLFLAAFASIAPVSAQAQSNANLIEVPNGQEKKIDRHLSCRLVKNTGAHPIMVATETSEEWNRGGHSFLSNYQDMPGITVRFCPAEAIIATADCGTVTETTTIQSFFTAAEWTNVDQEKILTIPGACNLCLNKPESAALTVGSSGWGGDLTVIIKGTVSGAASNPNSRNEAINVNRLGAKGQKINITVDGGKVVAGGFNGARGNDGSVKYVTGQRCYAGAGTGWCNQNSVMVSGSEGGAGGRGEHCGSAPNAGAHGAPGLGVLVPDDSLRTWQQQKCSLQMVNGTFQNVCEWVTQYAVNQGQTVVYGERGGNGAPGQAGTTGILNRDRAVVRVINGGHVRP